MNKFEDHELEFVCEIESPLDDVWKQWTTEEGLISFFAEEVRFTLEIGGPFEMLFDPDQPEGLKGGEGLVFLAIEEKKMLSFTWSSPPRFPEIRKQRTVVIVTFESTGENQTLVRLQNVGYGFGNEWQESLKYFRHAWGNLVLPRLKYSLETGPVDWNDLPDLG